MPSVAGSTRNRRFEPRPHRRLRLHGGGAPAVWPMFSIRRKKEPGAPANGHTGAPAVWPGMLEGAVAHHRPKLSLPVSLCPSLSVSLSLSLSLSLSVYIYTHPERQVRSLSLCTTDLNYIIYIYVICSYSLESAVAHVKHHRPIVAPNVNAMREALRAGLD